MTHLTGDDFAHLYPAICHEIVGYGDETSPRGKKTVEMLDYSFILTDPRKGLPVGTGRKLHTALGCAEALQLIAGESYPELMVGISANFLNFRDGQVLAGAYGPRIRRQMGDVIHTLTDDPDSRQAMAVIYDPAYDQDRKDIPCTIALQWTIRDEKLNMHVRMRSNDIWWGLPYDVFQFTQLQLSLASTLGMEPGAYYHTATSMHSYEKDWETAAGLKFAVTPGDSPWMEPLVFAQTGDRGYSAPSLRYGPSWGTLAHLTDDILQGGDTAIDHEWRGSHTWYADKLAKYVG
jgi:thymidylate synthase